MHAAYPTHLILITVVTLMVFVKWYKTSRCAILYRLHVLLLTQKRTQCVFWVRVCVCVCARAGKRESVVGTVASLRAGIEESVFDIWRQVMP